jgi:hypothetical protein
MFRPPSFKGAKRLVSVLVLDLEGVMRMIKQDKGHGGGVFFGTFFGWFIHEFVREEETKDQIPGDCLEK